MYLCASCSSLRVPVYVGPRLPPTKEGALPQSSSGFVLRPVCLHDVNMHTYRFIAVTPFELEAGGIVGVIQGWVPRKVEVTGAQQQQQQQQQRQQIVGVHSLPHETPPLSSSVTRRLQVVREEEERNRHTPPASISEGLFFAATSEDLSKVCPRLAPAQRPHAATGVGCRARGSAGGVGAGVVCGV